MVVGNALFMPQLNGLVVILIDRHVEAVLGKTQVLWAGDKFVGPSNCVSFGVATEGEVAEHLEEGKVTRIANILDIVGTQALLTRGRADFAHCLGALVILLKLVHARVGKEQRWVVRDER